MTLSNSAFERPPYFNHTQGLREIGPCKLFKATEPVAQRIGMDNEVLYTSREKKQPA